MEFKYQPEKTVEAAGLFLKLHDKPMEYMKLIKLLYMADRIALDRMYASITGDKYYSMNYGPVLSRVYDLIVHGPKIAPDRRFLSKNTPESWGELSAEIGFDARDYMLKKEQNFQCAYTEIRLEPEKHNDNDDSI